MYTVMLNGITTKRNIESEKKKPNFLSCNIFVYSTIFARFSSLLRRLLKNKESRKMIFPLEQLVKYSLSYTNDDRWEIFGKNVDYGQK